MLAIPAALGALLGLALGTWSIVGVTRGYRRLRAEVSAVPDPERGTRADELTPWELAYLLGGRSRVGEVVLADLHLSGRIRMEGLSGLFSLVGPPSPFITETEPIRRELITAFKGRSGLTGRGLVQAVSFTRGIDDLRETLAERGLLADPPLLPKLIGKRDDAGLFAQVLTILGITLGGISSVFLAMTVVNEWTLGGLSLATVVTLLSGIAWYRYSAQGDKDPSTVKPAGFEVMREVRREYKIRDAAELVMDRETALRHVAVFGLGLMGRQVPPRRFGHDGSFDSLGWQMNRLDIPEVEVSLTGHGTERAEVDEGAEAGGVFDDFQVDWGSLCRFAQSCAVDSGTSSGDGGAGGDEDEDAGDGDSGGDDSWSGGDGGGGGGDGGGGGGT